ncbi:MAG TPA: tetratricopeptide repeat protein [Candidatus Polarisedimenticolia bacterium]|nr:tetratricopeptide repeat protein [Candidatus Polarisedimenticolia bacterium]
MTWFSDPSPASFPRAPRRAPFRGPALLATLALALPGVPSPARADVVHLRNGATIVCDSIEERGTDLLLRQKSGVITVPRADVARIEKSAPPPTGTGGTSAVPATLGPPGSDLAADERRVEFLRRRIADRTAAAGGDASIALDRREIVARLTVLAEASLSSRRYEEARRRAEEALTYDPSNVRVRRGLGAALIGLEQPLRARTVLEQALLDKPDDPDTLVVLAGALERLDRTPEAIAALRKSNALRPDVSVRAQIETLERHQGIDGGYRRSEAAHFSLAYDGGRTTPELEGAILGYLEEQWPAAARFFDWTPREAIAVVVYPEKQFREATLTDSDVAGLYDGKVRVPSGGLRHLDDWSRAVLRHELAHAFIAGKSGGGAPRWLHEGLAQVVEGRPIDRGAEFDLGRDYEAARGDPRFGTTFTYASALSFVTFLQARYGQTALNDVLTAIGHGSSVEEAFQAVFRDSLPDLRAAWGEDLARKARR